jgi:hypothetical protein
VRLILTRIFKPGETGIDDVAAIIIPRSVKTWDLR